MTTAKWPVWWNAAWDTWFRKNRVWVVPHDVPPPETPEMLLLASPARGPLGGVAVTAVLSGTCTTATSVDIIGGGKTIILTVANDTWVASGGTFDGQRANIIAGISSSQIAAGLSVGDVVRTSANIVTITMDAIPGYTIASNETVTVTIPGTALTLGGQAVAVPTFTVTYISPGGEPTYAGLAGQTRVTVLDSTSTYYNSLSASGTYDPATVARFIPYPSPAFDGGAVNPTWCAIDPTGGKAGAKAVVNIYPTSGDTQLGGRWGIVNSGAIPVSHYLCSMRWFKMSGTAIGTNNFAIKWRHWELTGLSGGGQPQFYTHDHLPAAVRPGVGTLWGYIENAVDDGNLGIQPFGPYLQNLFDGQWHRETTVYKSHTSAGNKNGIAQLWIDGVLIVNVQQSTVGVIPPGGAKSWCGQTQIDNMNVNLDADSYLTWWCGGTRTEDPGTDVSIYTDIDSMVLWHQTTAP